MKSMLERFPRPDWVRRINAMGDSVGGAENMVSLDVDELIGLASKSTGLEDFGETIDGDWRGRLTHLVAALEGSARLNVVGRLMARQEILRSLRSRLFLAKALNDNPAIRKETILEPIIVTGSARSGTSILLELLGQDPRARAPIAFEALHAGSPNSDPEALRAMTECEQELWADVVPEFSAIHELRADLPDECVVLQKPSFGGMFWWILNRLDNWIPDLEAAMQYHKAVLQVLQYGQQKKTWVLKTPFYLSMLDLLFEVYPDAYIVLTHRDPVKTVPSGLSTLAAARWQRSDYDCLEEIFGMTATAMIDTMVDVHRRRKKGELPDRFVDLHFSDLMSSPVETIKRAYEQMGRPFAPDHEVAILHYLSEKPKGKFGKHIYTPEDWGFDSEALRIHSKPYMACYGVKPEE